MTYILHIDTSSENAVIMLSADGRYLNRQISTGARNHAAAINLLIDELLAGAGIRIQHLAAIAVTGGPGSYTGLRIGLATAKAYCYVWDKPLLLINKLDMLTAQLQETYHRNYNYYLTILPARAREYFACMYHNDGTIQLSSRHISEEGLSEYLQQLEGRILIQSEQETYPEGFTKTELTKVKEADPQFLSNFIYNLYEKNAFADLVHSEPFYLKQVYTHNKL